MDCLFCSIIKGEIPSSKVYEDDVCYAFNDIDPQAPVHVLIVPKEHIKWAFDIDETNSAVVAHIFEVIPKIAKQLGIEDVEYNHPKDVPYIGENIYHSNENWF